MTAMAGNSYVRETPPPQRQQRQKPKTTTTKHHGNIFRRVRPGHASLKM